QIARNSDERDSPVASASDADAPASRWFVVTELKIVATAATASDPPTYRAMFEMPEAAPTSFAETELVDADDAGPLASPRPTALAISGSTNAAYAHDAPTNARAPKPTVASRKPIATARAAPTRAARGAITGVIAIIAAAAGSVAIPAVCALMPNPA